MIRTLRIISITVLLLIVVLTAIPKLYTHAAWNFGMREFAIFAASPQIPPDLANLISAEKWFTLIPEDQIDGIAVSRVEQMQRLYSRYASPPFIEALQINDSFLSAKNVENEGNIEEAVIAYRKIIDDHPNFVPAYYQLYSIYESTGNNDEAERISQRLATLNPEYVINGVTEIDDVTVAGYQSDAFSLETLRPIPATIYWQAPAPVCATNAITHWQSDQDDLYCVNDKIFQITYLTNLAGVGEDLRYFQMPGLLGYRSGSSTEDLRKNDWRKFTYVEREGIPTIAFMLDNPSSMKNILISPNIRVEPGANYLLSGWIKTDKGQPNAGLGAVCFGESYTDEQRHYIPIRGSSVTEWTHFSNIIQVEETARICRVLLMNYGDADTVYFDDITFAHISSPSMESR